MHCAVKILPNSPMIDVMMELLSSDHQPIHLADTLDSNLAQQEHDDQEELDENNPLDQSELPTELESKKGQSKNDGCAFKPIPDCTQQELIEKARSLSFAQKIPFNLMLTFAKSVIRAEKSNKSLSALPPPLLIVHGGGGVGKRCAINHVVKRYGLFIPPSPPCLTMYFLANPP